MTRVTPFERYFLSQPIPSLGYPGLPDDASDVDVLERAHEIGYGDESFCKRGEGNLRALMMILGVVPSTFEERLAVVGG